MTGFDQNADQNHSARLAVLSACSVVSADLPRLVTLLSEAEDDADALARLQVAYDLTPLQAEAVLDRQLRLLNRARRAALERELATLREALAAPWDPPLEVHVTGSSPHHVAVVLDGVEHQIQSSGLEDCLDRIVVLVREQLALPRLRRVMVTTRFTDGTARVLIDPVGGAQFSYDDD